jgi:hypothetical protein
MLICFCIPLAGEHLSPNPEPCPPPGVGLQICHGAALVKGGSWVGHRTVDSPGRSPRRLGYAVGLSPGYPLRRPACHGGLTILEVRRVDAIYGPSIGMSPDAKWPGAIRLALIFVVPNRTSPGAGDGEFP